MTTRPALSSWSGLRLGGTAGLRGEPRPAGTHHAPRGAQDLEDAPTRLALKVGSGGKRLGRRDHRLEQGYLILRRAPHGKSGAGPTGLAFELQFPDFSPTARRFA